MEALKNQVLVSHYAPNHLLKQTKKKLRQNGRPVLRNGNPVYQQGKTARGSLHQETFYGAIKRLDEKSGKEVIKYVVRKKVDDLSPADIKKIVDPKVREIVSRPIQIESEIKELRKTLRSAPVDQKDSIQANIDELMVKKENARPELPNKNGDPIPIKKVRIYSNITNPIPLKAQGDLSRNTTRQHKEHYWVNNGENYCIAIYEGKDGNGNVVRAFRSFSNYAVTNQSKWVGDVSFAKRFDPIIKKGASLEYKYEMKPGTPVLFCNEVRSDDLKTARPDDISNRLYFMYGIKGDDGRSKFRFHQEARLDKDQETPASSVDIASPVAKLWISTSKLDLLVGGIDFKINVLGEIEFIGK
jgi:CRISPR-associated endonuclease Csn1